MLPAANRPILEHVFDDLIEAGLDRIVVVVGYRHDRVQAHFGPRYRGVPLTYVIQDKQLGSGHALLEARSAVSEPVLVVNGDRLIEASMIEDVVDEFETEDNTPTLAVTERQDARQYGAVELRGGDIQTIVEKPDTDQFRLINAGVYAFDESIFDAIDETPRQNGELALTDTISRLVENERVKGVKTRGMWVDATYPWDLLTVAREVLTRGRIHEPARGDGVWVDNEARIHDDATLQGPVVVGPDSEVGPGAVVGPNVALGRNVTLGANATVQESLVDADTRVDAAATLVDTVTGQDVHVGAGTIVPGGPADVRVGDRVFTDQQLGAVIADRVTLGGDVTVTPGSLVGPNAKVHPGVTITGRVNGGAEVMR
jgi:glucose-1-phosphate thymidylyltransferase